MDALPSTRSTTTPSSAITMRSRGTPVSAASCACARRWRHSPCTGMKLRGLTRLSRYSSSPAGACPETCTSEDSLCTTRAPSLVSPLITRYTAVSLPGIRLEARITVSPAATRIGWYPQVPEVAGDAHVADHAPPDEGDLPLVRRRGVENLLHPVYVRGEAGHDDPLVGVREHLVEHRGDVPLGPDDARHLGVGRVGQQQVDALAAEPREPGQVGQPSVERQLVHLEVAGVQHHAGRGLDRHGHGVWDRVVDREKFKFERSERPGVSLFDLFSLWSEAMLGELGPHQGQRQPGPDQQEVVPLAEQVRDGADVVLVGVRQDNRFDLVQPVFQVAEVRQDQVHARLVGLGEQDAAVDDQQPPAVLEDGHVPADLAETAQRDDAQAVAVKRRRWGQFGVRVTHRSASPASLPSPGSLTPPAVRSARSLSRSAELAGSSGPRTPPPGKPSMSRAALVMTAAWLRKSPTLTGSMDRWTLAASAVRPSVNASSISAIRSPTTCPVTLTAPMPPMDHSG